MSKKRSLFQCFNARVITPDIVCSKGHPLSTKNKPTIATQRLISGNPLEPNICQKCKDYDEMGPPVPVKDRGWLSEIIGG